MGHGLLNWSLTVGDVLQGLQIFNCHIRLQNQENQNQEKVKKLFNFIARYEPGRSWNSTGQNVNPKSCEVCTDLCWSTPTGLMNYNRKLQ
jgi:hypothetical protein